jgi:hypothetical protein
MSATRNQHAAYYRCSKATREGKNACEVHAYHRAEAVEQAAKLSEASAIEEVYPYRFIREMQRP